MRRRRMQSPVNCGSRLARRIGWNASGIDEGEEVDEVVGLVLDGRAGHGPAPFAVDTAHHLRRLRFAVLDSLGLVQHHHVEVHPLIGQKGGVARQQLVVDQLERAVRDEPGAAARLGVAADDLEGQVLGPGAQLA